MAPDLPPKQRSLPNSLVSAEVYSICTMVHPMILAANTSRWELWPQRTYVGPAATQSLVVKFDGEICGGVLVDHASDDFPSQRSSKIACQTSPEVRHQFRRRLRQLHSGNRWCLLMCASFLLTIEAFLLTVHIFYLRCGNCKLKKTKFTFRTGGTVSKEDQAEFPP